jgi:hypothetical protein
MARELAGPQSPYPPQSASWVHTFCKTWHMRSGPGAPEAAGTQVSWGLLGFWQVLMAAGTQVFA